LEQHEGDLILKTFSFLDELSQKGPKVMIRKILKIFIEDWWGD